MTSDIKFVASELIGKTVSKVEVPDGSDEGILLTFSDGTTLNCGWSGCEGSAILNNKEVKLWKDENIN